MPFPRARRLAPLIVLGLVVLVALLVSLQPKSADHRLGLFTTLPIMWSEAPSIADQLKADTPPHWAKAVLARYGAVVPLDTLGGLDQFDRLVLAQPRPLSADENVALDNWVQSGGQLLLLADPLLTEESIYGLGDRRRPQDAVLLSPILARWGLVLQFDETQPAGERAVNVLGAEVPVNLPGKFAVSASDRCRSWGEGTAVTCRIGKGRLIALADAAVAERQDPEGKRPKAFDGLLLAAFAGT